MIWQELKRRKVVQVATVYAAVSWALLEVVTLVEEPLGLPEWTDTLAIVLLAVGFVLAVALAWVYEITPEGITRDHPPLEGAPAPARPGLFGYAVTAVVAALLGAAAFSFVTRDTDRDWLEEAALPEIEERLAVGDWQRAYALAREIQARLPDTEELETLWPQMSWVTTIESDPAGATVSYQPFERPDDEWRLLGQTPLDSIHFPYGLSRIRLEREGYRTLHRTLGGGFVNTAALTPSSPLAILVGPERFTLDTEESLPDDKVRIRAFTIAIEGEAEPLHLEDYFLDRHEVTNAQFKEFVDAGGYQRANLWDDVVRDGVVIPFEASRDLFLDRTDQPGPGTWEAGDYPPGEEDHPVSGVSWYEASAYARFVGEELPTAHHWRQGLAKATLPWLLPESNLDGPGTRSVHESRAMSYSGAFDMAGNVREWTSSRLGDRYLVLGGGWNDPYYVASEDLTAAPALDRSPGNGFRLAVTHDEARVASLARRPLPVSGVEAQRYLTREPVSDAVYDAYRGHFAYDRGPLNDSLEQSVELRSWTRERITFDAGYAGERVALYLYLPKNASPPYQTVVYWPGWDSFSLDSVDAYFVKQADFLPRSGRALAFPVYMGSFERRDPEVRRPRFETTAYRDQTIAAIKDLRRTLDYLETRRDVDARSFAYFGYSWGGLSGPTALAQEPRLRSAVIYVGPMRDVAPEVDPINALPRVDVPLLLLTGEFDTVAPVESALRYFELVGSEVKDHVILPGGHYVPREDLIRESLRWLDLHQGRPVR